MTRRDSFVIGIAGVLLAALAVGMTVPPAQHASVVRATPSLPPPPVLREGVMGTVSTLDPLFARTPAERDLDALIFSGLTRLGPGDAIEPALATSWTVNSAGTVYTFHLDPAATWQDGTPVTAEDVVFTVQATQASGYTGPLAGAFVGVTAQAPDPSTVQFHLSSPTADFLLSTTLPILPAHLLAGVPVAQLEQSSFSRQPVGAGPFRLTSLDGSGATLTRVLPEQPTASTAPGGVLPPLAGPPNSGIAPPGLSAIQFSFFTDDSALVAAFRAGTIDAVGGLDPETSQALAALPGARLLQYPRPLLAAVLFNLRAGHHPFDNPHVRLAMLMTIDRTAIMGKLLGGTGTLADSLVPPFSWAYDATAAGRVAYNRTAAAKELEAARWTKKSGAWYRPGSKQPVSVGLVTLDQATNPLDYAIAQDVAAAWRSMGLRVTVTALSTTALAQQLVPGKFDAAVIDLNLGLDPDLFPLLSSTQAIEGGTNLSGYQSAKLDPLLEATHTYASQSVRKKRFAALEKELAVEMPILPLFYADYLYVVRSNIVGPAVNEIANGSGRFWNVLTWRTAESAGP